MKASQKLSIASQFSIIRVQLMFSLFFLNCGLAFQMHFMEILCLLSGQAYTGILLGRYSGKYLTMSIVFHS